MVSPFLTHGVYLLSAYSNNFVATAVSAALGIVEISGLLFIGLLVSWKKGH